MDKGCTVTGCERKHEAHGLCRLHYRRWMAHGDTDARKPGKPYTGRTAEQVRDVIQLRIKVTGRGCWEWQRARANDGGYGCLNWKGVHMAHRVSWAVHVGPIPKGLNVLHKCDNPPCCNPDHLFLGTLADNNADMEAKGRSNRSGLRAGSTFRGEAHGGARLTEEAVRDIRASSEPLRVLAERYGVKLMAVSRARAGKSWTHVV